MTFENDAGDKVVVAVPHGVSTKKVMRALRRLNVIGKMSALFDLAPKERAFAHEVIDKLKMRRTLDRLKARAAT